MGFFLSEKLCWNGIELFTTVQAFEEKYSSASSQNASKCFCKAQKVHRMKAALLLLKGFASGRKKGAILKVLVIYALCHCESGYKLVTL